MATFTTHTISSETRLARFIRFSEKTLVFTYQNIKPISLMLVVLYLMISMVLNTERPVAEAKVELTFGSLPEIKMPTLEYVELPEERPKSVPVKLEGYWQWKGARPYKNERLAYYQQALAARGKFTKEELRLLTAQLIQENGALAEDVIGDHGCSIGIIQYNTCAHHKMSGKTFLERHPEWKSWKYQIDYMADWVAGRSKAFNGNIRLMIIDHNCPACAAKGRDSKAGYYQSIKQRASLLI